VTLSNPTPTNTTFASVVTPAGWTRTDATAPGATGTITFAKTTAMPPSTSAVFSIVVTVNPGTASGTVITDNATAASPTDTTPGNNTGTTTTTVNTSADLTVTSVNDSPDPVNAGSNITYTINL